MKELTIEQKAKAYDEALDKARKLYSSEETSADVEIACENIFPELIESEDEDERIRKEIIDFLELPHPQFVGKRDHEKWLDWLEKQQDYIKLPNSAYTSNKSVIEFADKYSHNIWEKLMDNFNKIENYNIGCNDVSDIVLNAIINTYNWLEKQGETIKIKKGKTYLCTKTHKYAGEEWREGIKYYSPEDYSLVNQGCTYYCPEYSKEEHNNFFKEKEHAEIKPKFKVGDWIVNKGHSYLIAYIDYEQKRYLFEIGGYTHEQLNWEYIENADNKYHLWTVDDANDGDVLAEDSCIFIIQNLGDNGTAAKTYYTLYNDGDFDDGAILYFDVDSTKPATKEQHDAIIKSMKDAGLEFDFTKKELKKIEDEEYNGKDYGIDSLWHAKNILEKTLGKVDGYQSDDGILEHKCAISAIKKYYQSSNTEVTTEDRFTNK